MLYIFVFVFGLVFGSFISAISWRIPKNISFTKGRSMCPKCKNKIAWYDNIPVVSFLLLGGKCRKCNNSISFRYPLIELFSGISFIYIYHLLEIGRLNLLSFLLSLILYVLLFTIFLIDLENQIIPDPLTFLSILVFLIYLIISNNAAIFNLFFSGMIGAVFLLIIHLVTKGKGMGLGDVKLAILGGMLIGPRLLPYWLILSFIIGATAGILLILMGKAKIQSKIAFGPFLILGLVVTMFFGEYLTRILNLI